MVYVRSVKGYYYLIEKRAGKDIYLESFGKISKEKANDLLAEREARLKFKPIFRTIVIDPPWPMEKIRRDVAPDQIDMDYKTMSIEEIKKFPINNFVQKDGCQIYVWTTQKFLPITFDILKGWGFDYFFTMIWHKNGGFQPFNLPQYNAEFVLFGSKGSLKFTTTKSFFCAFNANRKEHSRKPDEFYDLVKRVSPEPRIDIFSREKRDGFEQYGYEAGKF